MTTHFRVFGTNATVALPETRLGIVPGAGGTYRLPGLIGLARFIPGLIMFGALYMLFYSVTPSKYRYTDSRKWPGAAFTTIWWVSMTALLPVALAQLGGYACPAACPVAA